MALCRFLMTHPSETEKKLATSQEYYATGSGYLYESRQDFSLVTINGTPEDWVTSEADGAALEALFSTSDSIPW